MATIQCPTDGSQLSAFLRQSYRDAQGEFPLSSPPTLSIRIDDRQPSDVSLDFCSISVLIGNTAAARFTLYLKNPPLDDDVEELIRKMGGTITGSRPDLHVEIRLLCKQVCLLRKLAKAVRRIVGRGRSYPNANWKWICPRTASSIDRLADQLMEYRRIRGHAPWQLAAKQPSVVPVAGLPTTRVEVKSTQVPKQTGEENLFDLLGM